MKFEDLEVWKRSARLCASIYKELQSLTDYSFKRQITSAVLSISSNIAEGYERESKKETLNFLSYAKGSCGELRSQIYRNGYQIHQYEHWSGVDLRSEGYFRHAEGTHPNPKKILKIDI